MRDLDRDKGNWYRAYFFHYADYRLCEKFIRVAINTEDSILPFAPLNFNLGLI